MTEPQDLPPRTHPAWNAVATGKIDRQWTALGMRIMMTRVTTEVAKDGSPANVQKHGDEIYDFFKKNAIAAAADLRAIFG